MPNRGIGAYQPDTAFSATPARGKNYLLVIGIDQYQHFPRLNNAVRDAQAFAALLHERFQFDVQHTETLFDENATERQLLFKLRDMARLVTPEDNLVIYFSGHGEFDPVFDEGYWIPADAQQGAMEDYIANSKIHKVLGAIKSRHTFLVIDSCFSGSLFMQYRTATGLDRLEALPSRWGLTSGRNEVVPDGPAGQHSPFAGSLLNQLRLSQGDLGVGELCQRVVESVAAHSSQIPRGEPLRVEGHEGGQFFFRLRQHQPVSDTAGQPAATVHPARGGLLYSIPAAMEIEQECRCEVRIAYDKAALLVDFDTSREHAVRDIRISNLMQVELIDPRPGGGEAFAVRTLSSAEQFIDPDEYTEWIFYVKALQAGIHPLALKVTVIEVLDGKERRKEIVLEEQVEVRTHLSEEIEIQKYKSGYPFSLEVQPVPESVVPPPPVVPAPAPQVPPASVRPGGDLKDLSDLVETVVSPTQPMAPRKSNMTWIRAVAGVVVLLIAVVFMLPYFAGSNKSKSDSEVVLPAPSPDTTGLVKEQKAGKPEPPPVPKSGAPREEMIPERLSDRTRSEGEGRPLDTYIDQRDGKRYPAVKTGGQVWLQRNLAYETEGAACYGDKPLLCENLGALYTWDAAMRACPSGWRLPDAVDWDALLNAWGGYEKAKSYEAMIYGGKSFFQAQLAGKQAPDGSFAGLHEEGYFWTRSASGSKEAVAIEFVKATNTVRKVAADKKAKLSCRCVKG